MVRFTVSRTMNARPCGNTSAYSLYESDVKMKLMNSGKPVAFWLYYGFRLTVYVQYSIYSIIQYTHMLAALMCTYATCVQLAASTLA